MKKYKVMKGEEVLLEVSDKMLAEGFIYGVNKGAFECINILYDEMLPGELRNKLMSKILTNAESLRVKEEGDENVEVQEDA